VLVDVLQLGCLFSCFLDCFLVYWALEVLLELYLRDEGSLAELTALRWLRCQRCCCHDSCIRLLGCLEGLCSLLAGLIVLVTISLKQVNTATKFTRASRHASSIEAQVQIFKASPGCHRGNG
jgi:hypothetical protein